MRIFLFLLLSVIGITMSAQVVYGRILDEDGITPLEGVNVYFNRTSLGTVTNENGTFRLETSKIISSSLIFSFLGYETIVYDKNPYGNQIILKLQTKNSSLDEVVVSQDYWSREEKLRAFKEQFLGTSQAAKYCTILNEDDIDITFNRERKKLEASADVPLTIRSPYLGYTINYDLSEFQAVFKNINPIDNEAVRVYFSGNSRYQDNAQASENYKERRFNEYSGSITHFFQSLRSGTIKKNGFKLLNDNYISKKVEFMFGNTKISGVDDTRPTILMEDAFEIIPNDEAFRIRLKTSFYLSHDKYDLVEVSKGPINISFIIDRDGNYSPADAIQFGFSTDFERVGNLLPLDFDVREFQQYQKKIR